jgi:hypothetical protein
MSRARVVHLALAAAALAAAGCASPEASRQRGGGRGADVGNRDAVVEMHEGSRMYYRTPCLIPEEECTGPMPASGMPGDFPEKPRPAAQEKRP